ncbi:MAG: hypothetical protein EOL90_00280 [Spartobacteria bacterium]|nr:hypothetical protein [Spartobacteria bacterium]
MNIQKINLDLLTDKDGSGKWAQFNETGVRECCGPLTICDYADEMTEGSAFPPVVLFYDGQRYWIADGFHRIAAAEQCGFKEIEADVREGTRLDAVWFALGANRQHGRRMTHDDRIAAVKRGVIEFQVRSNREIARQIGCDDKTVAAVRASLESTAEIPQLDRTVGADGKARPAKRESKAQTVEPSAAIVTSKSFAESYRADNAAADDEPAAADLVSFLPANGQVASAFVEASASPDGNTHWFLLQEDSRNPGFFFAVHVDFGEDDTDGRIDFNMRAFRADAFADDRLSPIARWAAGIPGVKLSWDATDESPDWLWAGFIEPFLPDRMAHVKRTKTTEA